MGSSSSLGEGIVANRVPRKRIRKRKGTYDEFSFQSTILDRAVCLLTDWLTTSPERSVSRRDRSLLVESEEPAIIAAPIHTRHYAAERRLIALSIGGP